MVYPGLSSCAQAKRPWIHVPSGNETWQWTILCHVWFLEGIPKIWFRQRVCWGVYTRLVRAQDRPCECPGTPTLVMSAAVPTPRGNTHWKESIFGCFVLLGKWQKLHLVSWKYGLISPSLSLQLVNPKYQEGVSHSEAHTIPTQSLGPCPFLGPRYPRADPNPVNWVEGGWKFILVGLKMLL